MRTPLTLRACCVALCAWGAAACTDSSSSKPTPNLPECGEAASAADAARARQIDDPALLIPGPEAAGRVGDFLLDNGVIRVVVEGTEQPRLWLPYGGSLIDAARADGEDWLFQIATLAGVIRTASADSVEVIADGSDGCPAVVRVKGRDAGVPVIDAGALGVLRSTELAVETDYILRPKVDYVELRTRFTPLSPDDTRSREIAVGDALSLGDALSSFAPGQGFGDDALQDAGNVRWIAAQLDGVVSYGWARPDGGLGVPISQDELQLANYGDTPVGPDASGEVRRFLIVGDGDIASLQPSLATLLGEAPGQPVALQVVAGDAPVAGARVTAWQNDAPQSVAVTDASGLAQFTLPDGRYRFEATAPQHAAGESLEVTFPAGDLPLVLTLGAPGRVRLDIGHSARIAFVPAGAADPLRASGHEHRTVSGTEVIDLLPGSYQAVVSRGYEYELAVVPIEVTAGEEAVLTASLTRSIDTSGWISVDFHTHMSPSIDSAVRPSDRVRQAASEGLEVVGTSDHDIITDLAPAIAAEGAQGIVASVVGAEISPPGTHVNGFPLDPVANPGYLPVPFSFYDAEGNWEAVIQPSGIFRALREDLNARLVQLNHPRDDQGLLDVVGFDPTVGFASVDSVKLDRNFNAMEVVNKRWDETTPKQLQDLYGFWNEGHLITAMGNSDTHGMGDGLGHPRTYVSVANDDPGALNETELLDSILAGRVGISGGIFMTVEAAGSAGARALHVRVQAPSWIATTRLDIIVAGETFSSVDIPASDEVLRFDQEIPLAGVDDTWVMVHAHGDGDLAPVKSGHAPFALSNPLVLGTYP